MVRRHLLMMVGLLSLLVLSGCGETIRGVGQDLSRVGQGVKTIFGTGQ